MAVTKAGDDQTAPRGAGTRWRAARRDFLVSRGMTAKPEGDESLVAPLREDERGAAVLRSDLPHRARMWSRGELAREYDIGDQHGEISDRWPCPAQLDRQTDMKACAFPRVTSGEGRARGANSQSWSCRAIGRLEENRFSAQDRLSPSPNTPGSGDPTLRIGRSRGKLDLSTTERPRDPASRRGNRHHQERRPALTPHPA